MKGFDNLSEKINIKDGLNDIIEIISFHNSRIETKVLIQKILHCFLSMGFQNARYYDVYFNVPIKDDLLILAEFCGDNASNYKKGFKINYLDSTLGNKSNNKISVVDDSSNLEPGSSQYEWIDVLGLKNSCWVDIPVIIGSDLIGVIACDWKNGRINDLDKDDLTLLNLLGLMIAGQLGTVSNNIKENISENLRNISKNVDSIDQLLNKSLEEIRSGLNIAIASIFNYDWSTNKLYKIEEVYDRSLECKKFDESYLVAECLTGMAWKKKEYRFIIDFESLSLHKPNLISNYSHERHCTILKNITSVMYGILGQKEKNFLIRFINRIDEPEIPLNSQQYALLNDLIIELSRIIDDFISEERLNRLRNLTRMATESLSKFEHSLEALHNAFTAEGFQNIAILSHLINGIYFNNEHYFGDLFRNFPKKYERSWKDDSLYEMCIEDLNPTVINLSRCKKQENTLAEYLLSLDIKYVLSFPFSLKSIKGVIIIPLNCKSDTKHTPAIKTLQNLFPEKFKTLITYSEAIGKVIEAVEANISSEGARRLIGHIGHEISTPTQSLSQGALSALLNVYNQLPYDSKLKDMIMEERKSIKEDTRQLGKQMEVAMMVAQQHQKLQLNFRSVNFYKLLDKWSREIKTEKHAVKPNGTYRGYNITLSESSKKIENVVCDPDLLQIVFKNILSNAIKFSLPRYPGKIMIIDIIGQPQIGMNIIQIKNWGIGIPADMYERIFGPYIRGQIIDERKAIRGMGLGLYIARRIVTAHGGSIFCKHSKPMLDDPVRIKKYEGYETIFEIRIPTTLKPGVKEFLWGEWI